MTPKRLNKAEFLQKVWNFEADPGEWKFLGARPAIVDFYAPWCGPCRQMGEVLEELAAEYDGKVDFYKVNTDEEEELAAAFNVMSIPSLLFCPVAGDPQMSVGFRPKEALKNIIDTL